jgi:HD-GYP domain-containing protein (c-di-GMP phosphodiesterase class II)
MRRSRSKIGHLAIVIFRSTHWVKATVESEGSLAGLTKVPIAQLMIGMYIAKLDRPWLESSFPVQGFYIRSHKGIHRVGEECEFVYVDPRRYDSSLIDVKLKTVSVDGAPNTKKADRIRPRSPTIYQDTTELADEMVPATTSLDEAVEIMENVVRKVQTTGGFDIPQIEAALKPLVASVLRNKDAAAALLRIRTIDDYTYSHAISCAVWAAICGRELGFPPEDIDLMALGCSMLDIGKTTWPEELLTQADSPTDEQWTLIRSHVAESLAILEASECRDLRVIEMVKTHHERFDGSGYPNGLSGSAIPVFGRVAAIIDSYDAMITERPYAQAKSSYAAVQELQSQADVLYQRQLVEHFIRAVGVFPVGTIVEMNTGEVGVVVAQHESRRLRPKVMLILDADKNQRPDLLVTDLAADDEEDGKPLTVWITKELPTHAFGIDPGKYFI